MVWYWLCLTYGWDDKGDMKTPMLTIPENQKVYLEDTLKELGVRFERPSTHDCMNESTENEKGYIVYALHPDTARKHHKEFLKRFKVLLTEAQYRKEMET